jgi:hypothetical protein
MRGTFRLMLIPFILGTLLVAGVWLRAQPFSPRQRPSFPAPISAFGLTAARGTLLLGFWWCGSKRCAVVPKNSIRAKVRRNRRSLQQGWV